MQNSTKAISRRGFLGTSLAVAGTIAGTGLLSSCGKSEPVAGSSAKRGSRNITWYTSAPSEFSSLIVKQFNESQEEWTASMYYNVSNATLQRVQSEIRAGRLGADLLMVADPTPFMAMKKQGLFYTYENSPQLPHYSEKYRDADGAWVTARAITTCISYNTKSLPGGGPTGWEDLTSDKWSGKVSIGDVQSGGTIYNWYYVMRKTYGVDFWKALAATKPAILPAHGPMMEKTISGELPISEQLGYYVYNAIKDKAPVKGVWTDPVPLSMAPIAIMKDAPNIEGAKVFFDWLLSVEGQTAVQVLNGAYSVRDEGIKPLEGKPPFADLDIFTDYDWAEYEAKRVEWTKEFVYIFHL